MFARYAASRNITVERLLEISHFVVRDHTHILSRKPPASQLPVPSSLLTSAHLLPQPGDVYKTLQLIASKFAEVSASTKPPLADASAAGARAFSTVAPNAPCSIRLRLSNRRFLVIRRHPPQPNKRTAQLANRIRFPRVFKHLSPRLRPLVALKDPRQTPRLPRPRLQCPRTRTCKNRALMMSRSRTKQAPASIYQPTQRSWIEALKVFECLSCRIARAMRRPRPLAISPLLSRPLNRSSST